MAVKTETPLQERIQTLIRQRGGYVVKQHGDMISEPGIPDLLACYRGIFLGIEVKVNDNTPSKQQGIQCRKIWQRGGIAMVTWTTDDVISVLSFIDRWIDAECLVPEVIKGVETQMQFANIDNGRNW